MSSTHPWAVIMAGGSGTRFWPVSRVARPKQLLDLLGEGTLIQATIARLQPLIPAERVLIVTTAALAAETRRQLPQLRAEQVIAEPVGRDTAACVALAALIVERLDPGGTMILLPADQVISPADDFQAALSAGCQVAASGSLVVYGIAPRFAATGYGYIELGDELPRIGADVVHRVQRFVEKPDVATAARYVQQGTFRWNAGIFTWRTDVVLRELGQHCPWLTAALAPLAPLYGTPDFAPALAEAYGPLKKISIDFALMEHAKDIVAITGRFTWDDLGSWDALYDHLPHDAAGVAVQGATQAIDCADTLLVAHGGQTVVGIGLSGLTVVATADAVLVMPRGRSQEVKLAVDRLKAAGSDRLL